MVTLSMLLNACWTAAGGTVNNTSRSAGLAGHLSMTHGSLDRRWKKLPLYKIGSPNMATYPLLLPVLGSLGNIVPPLASHVRLCLLLSVRRRFLQPPANRSRHHDRRSLARHWWNSLPFHLKPRLVAAARFGLPRDIWTEDSVASLSLLLYYTS